MPRAPRARSAPPSLREPQTYARLSMRPLHILVFLAPFLIAYEIGAAIYLRGGGIRAHGALDALYRALGVGGPHLPAITMTVVLLVWHVMRKDPWTVRPHVLAGMLVESIAWKAPLLVLAMIVGAQRAAAQAAPEPAALALAAGDPFATLSTAQRVVVGVGAGLYEELLFRMVGVALVHFIAADLLKVSHKAATVAAIVVTAAAFALHHDAWRVQSDLTLLAFYFAAGLYFGALYVFRGFGIVVAVHALYDLVVLLQR